MPETFGSVIGEEMVASGLAVIFVSERATSTTLDVVCLDDGNSACVGMMSWRIVKCSCPKEGMSLLVGCSRNLCATNCSSVLSGF
jgi:hypothetical protein